jgi:cytochrome c-type biogenesis protein CcmH/NrfG
VGFTLSILDRQAEAVLALERSLQIDPAQAKVWAVLIEAQRLLGRRAAALDAYEKLRALDGKAAEEAWRANFAGLEEKGAAR